MLADDDRDRRPRAAAVRASASPRRCRRCRPAGSATGSASPCSTATARPSSAARSSAGARPTRKTYGDDKLGAVGRPHAGVEVAHRRRRPASCSCRIRRPASTTWQHTGDIGRIDDDGFVWIEGRVSDMINRGGLKVHPGEVEEVLRLSPGVADAAVVGVPDDRLGEVPVGVRRRARAGRRRRRSKTLCRTHLAPVQGAGALRAHRRAAPQRGRQGASSRPCGDREPCQLAATQPEARSAPRSIEVASARYPASLKCTISLVRPSAMRLGCNGSRTAASRSMTASNWPEVRIQLLIACRHASTAPTCPAGVSVAPTRGRLRCAPGRSSPGNRDDGAHRVGARRGEQVVDPCEHDDGTNA